jgi:hypothetical protein
LRPPPLCMCRCHHPACAQPGDSAAVQPGVCRAHP